MGSDSRDHSGLDEAKRLFEELKLRRLVIPQPEWRSKLGAYQRAMLRASAAGFSDGEIASFIGGNVSQELEWARHNRRYAHVDEENRILKEVLADYRIGVLTREQLKEKLLNWPYRQRGEPAENVDPYDGPIHKQDRFMHVEVAYEAGGIDEELFRELWNRRHPHDPI